MKLNLLVEELSFNIETILPLKMLEVLVKCINAYKTNQSNDFDET